MTQREEFEAWYKEVGISEYECTDEQKDSLFNYSLMVWQAAKAQAVPQWIPVSERLPDENYCYFLVVRKYWNEGQPRVCYSFYIKDRDMAKKEHANGYSRKRQGKDSIHFECSRGGFIITHWMPLPKAPEQK